MLQCRDAFFTGVNAYDIKMRVFFWSIVDGSWIHVRTCKLVEINESGAIMFDFPTCKYNRPFFMLLVWFF